MKNKFFEIAKRLSEKSEYKHKLGAVVVKKGKILGLGFNKPNKTHPKSPNRWRNIHAELDAILGIHREDLIGSTIYIYREYKDGSPASSKPCPDCENLIRLAGIKKVCYTDNREYKEYVV